MKGSGHKGKIHYFPQHHSDNEVFLYLTTAHAIVVLQWEKFELRLLTENKFMRRATFSLYERTGDFEKSKPNILPEY